MILSFAIGRFVVMTPTTFQMPLVGQVSPDCPVGDLFIFLNFTSRKVSSYPDLWERLLAGLLVRRTNCTPVPFHLKVMTECFRHRVCRKWLGEGKRAVLLLTIN